MATDILFGLLRANVAAGVAILLALALRKPIRRAFGVHVAYGLWLIVPLAAFDSLLPAAGAAGLAPAGLQTAAGQASAAWDQVFGAGPASSIIWLWLAGASLAFSAILLGQWRFLRQEKAGAAGPAVVGVLFPRMVTPADFDQRFDEDERRIVRAHERAHIARSDARTNALLGLAQCLCWFNPLVHLAAYHIRLDQELACDATVLVRFPKERRRYAQTLLKTQMARSPLPLGCHWPARSAHPLEERVAVLKLAAPDPARRLAGAAAVVAVGLLTGYGAWAAQPAAPAPVSAKPEPRAVVFMDLSRPTAGTAYPF